MLKNKGAGWVAIQLLLLGLIALAPAHFGGLPSIPDSLQGICLIAGLLIGAAGLVIVGLSALYLGTNLSIFPRPKDDGTLTQTGLYGIVRHPMYGGVLLSGLGWALVRASLMGLLLTLALGIFFDQKARREEVWLTQKYPDYVTYRQKVRKLIPWVY